MTNGEAPTTPRPRIAALERGPGPARYAMATLTGYQGHDTSRKMFPSYSFGLKLGSAIFKKDVGPGPCHAIDPSCTYRGMDGTPHYSLAARHKDLAAFKTPGPSAYSAEKVPVLTERKQPSFSMGSRTRYRKRDATPSPNTYSLPTLLGPQIPNRTSSACFSLTSRPKIGGIDQDTKKTPGPGRYGITTADVYARKAPSYTIKDRSYMPGDATKRPGPGAHCPERVTIIHKAAPSYSMGVRHSEFMCPLIIDVCE